MRASWLDGGTISPAELTREGITSDAWPTDPAVYQPQLDALKAERGYVAQDEVALWPEMPNLPAILDKFRPEHLHDDDEVRFVLSGEGVFDIRSTGDRWMRVEVSAGDLIVVPSGRNHRFFLTDSKAIRCVRLFQDTAGWVPRYRG